MNKLPDLNEFDFDGVDIAEIPEQQNTFLLPTYVKELMEKNIIPYIGNVLKFDTNTDEGKSRVLKELRQIMEGNYESSFPKLHKIKLFFDKLGLGIKRNDIVKYCNHEKNKKVILYSFTKTKQMIKIDTAISGYAKWFQNEKKDENGKSLFITSSQSALDFFKYVLGSDYEKIELKKTDSSANDKKSKKKTTISGISLNDRNKIINSYVQEFNQEDTSLNRVMRALGLSINRINNCQIICKGEEQLYNITNEEIKMDIEVPVQTRGRFGIQKSSGTTVMIEQWHNPDDAEILVNQDDGYTTSEMAYNGAEIVTQQRGEPRRTIRVPSPRPRQPISNYNDSDKAELLPQRNKRKKPNKYFWKGAATAAVIAMVINGAKFAVNALLSDVSAIMQDNTQIATYTLGKLKADVLTKGGNTITKGQMVWYNKNTGEGFTSQNGVTLQVSDMQPTDFDDSVISEGENGNLQDTNIVVARPKEDAVFYGPTGQPGEIPDNSTLYVSADKVVDSDRTRISISICCV